MFNQEQLIKMLKVYKLCTEFVTLHFEAKQFELNFFVTKKAWICKL